MNRTLARGDSANRGPVVIAEHLLAPADSPIRRSIGRHLVIGVLLLYGVGFGVGGWAATTNFAGAVVSSGFLVVDTSAKKVQHPTGGVVAELNVREGDHVKENQIILRFDETQMLSQLMMVTKALDELQARQARLDAERDDANEPDFPSGLLARASLPGVGGVLPDGAKAVAGERKLFELRRTSRSGLKSQLQQRIGQLQEEIQGLIGQAGSKNRKST